MLTLEQAKARLGFMCASTSEPTLSDGDLTELLTQAKRASLWTTATAVTVGMVIQPTTPNGHRYLCTESGTTGATEPTWAKEKNSVIYDGSATWREVGMAYGELYDLRYAAHLGWLRKAATVVADYSFSVDGQRFDRSDLHTHCLEMANRFAPLVIA